MCGLPCGQLLLVAEIADRSIVSVIAFLSIGPGDPNLPCNLCYGSGATIFQVNGLHPIWHENRSVARRVPVS